MWRRILIFAALSLLGAASAQAQSGTITSSYFGMQCGVGTVSGSDNCPNQTGTEDPTWPTSVAQPGVLRLWDSQVAWSWLMTGYSGGVGTYNWAQLDGYLDVAAAHQPVTINYVFGCVPVFAMPNGSPTGPSGSCSTSGGAVPPSDLTSSGSPTFTQFVTDLVNHCSPNGNCVKTLIKNYELWNEADIGASDPNPRWDGTQTQLYQMVAPAVAVIEANVSGAKIFTPSITSGTAAATWMTGWLNAEIAGGVISNVYNIHQYLNNSIPENVLSATATNLAPNSGTAGWTPLPWVMGETGYDDVTFPYSCNAGNTGTLFSTNDCVGQMARWNLLLFSNAGGWASGGGSGLYWYYWNTYIGSQSQYATAYFSMMQYLVGGHFTAAAANLSGSIWTAPFVESSGLPALWVWSTSESGASYTPASSYADYRDLSGNTTSLSGSAITVGVEPFLLEQATQSGSASPGEYLCTADSLAVAPENNRLQDGTHSVSLNWNASTSPSVWYRVYRGTVSGGPYTRIADCLPGLSYTDAAVADGQSYFYVVTAVSELNGAESGYSNQVDAQIPLYDTIAVSTAQNTAVTISTALTTSDGLKRHTTESRAPAENLSASDSLSDTTTGTGSLAETLSTHDTLTVFSDGSLALAETLSTGDSLGAMTNGQTQLSETLTSADVIDPSTGKSLSESLTTSDSIARQFTGVENLSETLATPEDLTAVQHGQRFYSQSLPEVLSTLDSIVAPIALPIVTLVPDRHVRPGTLAVSFTGCNPNGNSFSATGREILLVENADPSNLQWVTVVSVPDSRARFNSSLINYPVGAASIVAIQMKYQAGWSANGKVTVLCIGSAIHYAVLRYNIKP